jgi:hypothetical protein
VIKTFFEFLWIFTRILVAVMVLGMVISYIQYKVVMG